MAGIVGRKCKIILDSQTVIGVRTITNTATGESIDLTAGENNGIRTLLEESAQQALDWSIEGILKDPEFRDRMLTSSTSMYFSELTLQMAPLLEVSTNPATIVGPFRMSNYEEGMPYNDAVTFTATLESAGPWVYTPES